MTYIRKRSVSVNDRGHVVGQDHHRSRIPDHDIDLIRELRDSGMSVREIAAKFEISVRLVRKYLTGQLRAQLAIGQKLVRPSEPRFRPARARDFGDEGP